MNSFVPRSIAYNYPGFQLLPRGIKRLLLVSETHFFSEETTGGKPIQLPLPTYLPRLANSGHVFFAPFARLRGH